MQKALYKLLSGNVLDLSELNKQDFLFIVNLQQQALATEDYFDLERTVCGPGAYPLKGSQRVTKEIHATTLFRVAEDIAFRAGIKQGVIAPKEDEVVALSEGIMSVKDAMKLLGITRPAILKAAKIGKLKGKKNGGSWVLAKHSVEAYRVSKHRVAAGKAAHH